MIVNLAAIFVQSDPLHKGTESHVLLCPPSLPPHVSRSDEVQMDDCERQQRSRESRSVSLPSSPLLYLPKHQQKVIHAFLDRVRDYTSTVNECIVCSECYHGMR